MYLVKPEDMLWGLPYHGKVQNKVLTDCSGKTHPVVKQPVSPDCWRVAHPRKIPLSLTTEQKASYKAKGIEWTNHTYLSGITRVLANVKEFGSYTWLYCDSRRVWVIEYDIEPGTGSVESPQSLNIYVIGMFGGLEGYKEITPRRLLGTFTSCEQGCDYSYSNYYQKVGHWTHSSNLDGSVAVLCERYFFNSTNTPQTYFNTRNGPYRSSNNTGSTRSNGLSSTFRIKLSGNGSISPSYRGQGIQVAFEVGVSDHYWHPGAIFSLHPTYGYILAHWINHDESETFLAIKTLWNVPQYTYVTGRVVTLFNSFGTIIHQITDTAPGPPDEIWFVDPADGGWNGSVYFNGCYCVGPGSSFHKHIYSDNYVGLMGDIVIVSRYGSYIQGIHRSGKVSEEVLRKDMIYGSDYFVYDDYHDVWHQHAFTQDGSKVVGFM